MAQPHRLNQLIGKTAIVSIIIALCAASAQAIWPGVESIKIAPLTITLESSGLKGDGLASETQAARQLFDRATTTAYAPKDTREIVATLEGQDSVHAIRIFGAAPYLLSVDADQGGAWSALAGLQDIDLSHLGDAWNSIPLGVAARTGRLRFKLVRSPSASVTGEEHEGLKELEVWGEGTRINLKSAAALLDALNSKSEVPAQGRQYLAKPEQGVIGAPDKMTDDPADNTFTVKLPRSPVDYKRVHLAYEVNGIAHWVHALRQINGNAAQGGFGLPINESWTTQLEEINPAWLKQGDNAITFAPPRGETGTFTVRNVRLLGELDNGSNFIMHASGNASETSTEAQSVLDGDNSTGWKPYGATSDDGTSKLTLTFDKPTQVSDLKFFLSNQLKGKFHIEYLKDEKHWSAAALGAIEGKNLTAGWNMLDAPSEGIVNGMRFVFSGGAGSSADIRELVVSGSSAGDTWPEAISVSYPDAGQYFGRVAYLRGYLQPVANSSGAAELTVAGKRIAQADGAFGVTISKDDIGLKKQSDRAAWSVEVKATYPDGKTVSRKINLNNYSDAIDPKDTRLPSTYKKLAKPGQHAQLEFDGAGLELSGAEIGKDITLGIRTLSAKELAPVNAGMTNVTRAGRGYRFTPTPMKFSSQLKVSIPYDPALLPRGKTEKDIKTFYYDVSNNRWRELQRFSIDKTKHKIISLSDHFTDMINATVTVPEHPDAVSFNPNSIKDIKAADPGAGINLIEPPKPNNTGDARLSYPIEIPPGRQGMQPNLSVNYSSGGGNGWMGLGWDLSVPSISVDTRWGVPRYSTENETETYLLNGEMLTPVAHRGILRKRTDNLGSWKGETVKFFHTRVEGAFSKIIRHGTAPANYWWEVIDKNGTRNLYGGVDQNDASGKLGSPAGVFRWSLRQTRDTHDNTVNYTYARVCDTGTGTGNNANGGETCSGGVPGHQLYISQIGYTGRLGDPTVPYTIDFVRASQLPNQPRRLDVIIDARGGFKQVTADRLKRIEVKFNGSLVRRYEVNYQTGAFDKTLLANVVQQGSDGSEFYRHTFAYFDEIRNPDGDYIGFGTPQLVKTGDDNLAFNSMGGALPHTVLGGTEGRSVGFDGYAGVGVISGTKMINVGIAPSISQSESTGSNAFIDVDGDGLPDKVFMSGGGARYRKNTSSLDTPDQLSFASGSSPQAIAHFAPPSATQSETFSLGVQGFLYGLALNASRGKTRTRDMSYLSDINGDGLVDIVDRGNVLFNTARNTGIADFQNNSYLTGVPLGNVGGAVDVNKLPGVTPAEKAQFEADYPLMDNVRRWVAPFDGEVRISGAVQLVDFAVDPPIDASVKDAEREFVKKLAIEKRRAYKQADGVIVSIQKNGEHPRWERRIEETDYDEHQPDNVDAVPVKKGDRLYFRLQSVYDGAYDLVKWSPTIEYVKNGTGLSFIDVHGRNAYRFQAAEDFILANRTLELAVPYRGTIRLAGQMNKSAATNDDVLLRVTVTDHTYDSSTGDVKNSAPRTVVAKRIAWDFVGPLMLDEEFQVGKDSGIKIDFVAESPVDFAVFKWGDPNSTAHPQPGMPELYYTEAWQEDLQPLAPATSTTSSTLPGNADSMMPTGTDGMQPILDKDGNPIVQHEQKLNVYDDNGQFRFKMPVKYGMEIYSQDHLVSPQKPWVAPRDGNILWTPWIKLKTYSSTNPDTGITTHETHAPNGSVEITAKRRSELLVNQVVQIKDANRLDPVKNKKLNGKIDETTQGYAAVQVMHVKAGDEIFFDSSTRDPDIESELESSVGYIHYASDTPWQVPLSDKVAFYSRVQGSVPPPSDNSGDGAPPVSTPPLDGRGVLVVRNGSNVIVFKQIIDFAKTSVADIVYSLKLNAGEKLYFDVFTKEPKVNIFQNQSWASYTAVSSWVAPFAGDISITPVLNFGKGAPDGSVTLNVIQNGVIIGQQLYNVSSGKVAGSAISMTVAANQHLEFGYSTTSYPLSSYLKDKGSVEIDFQKAAVPANLDNWTPQVVGSRSFTIDMPGFTALQTESVTANHYPEPESLFGNSFRGWGTAAYNGSGPLATSPINENLLIISQDQNDYKDPNKHRSAWPAYPVVEEGRWGNQDDLWWTSPVEMSASRKGLDNLYDPKLENLTESRLSGVAGAARPPRMSHGDIQTMGAGFVLSRTQSDITMTSDLELMDMNGDRFPDVVSQGGIQYTWADGNFFDSGAGIGAARGTVEASTTIGLGPGGPGCTCTAGANKPDNSGDKLLAELSSIPIAMSGTTGTNNVDHDLIDINGDGLPDRVRVSGNAIKVQLNTGYVFAGEETWSNGAPVALPSKAINAGNSSNTSLSASFAMWNAASGGGVSVSKGHNYASTTLMDINGDGLNDIVTSQGANLGVWLNTGAGFAAAETWPGAINSQGLSDGGSSSASISAKFGFSFDVLLVNFSFSFAGNTGQTVSQPTTSYIDVNGDGFVDGVNSVKDSEMSVALNPIRRTNLLKTVRRPLGATIELDYKRDGNTYDMPQSRWVLSKTKVTDGVTGDGVDTLSTAYQYENGKYDRFERDFFGYAKVIEQQLIPGTTSESVYRSTVREYLNGNFYTKGLLWRERLRKGDNDNEKYTETQNTYVLYEHRPGSSPDATGNLVQLSEPVDAEKLISATIFPQLFQTDRRFYEGTTAAGKTTLTTYRYDNLGNVVLFTDYGDAGDADNVVADIGYSHCDNIYVVGKPLSITVTGNGRVMRQREADIECVTGNIFQVRQLLETVPQAAVTDIGYYGNGNLRSVEGPANYKGERHFVEYDYDPIVQTHITGIHDKSYRLDSAAVYNYKYGKVEATTDTNGNVTSMEYDRYGRTHSVNGPYDQGGAPTIRFDYHPEADASVGLVPYAVSFHLDKDANGLTKPDTIDTILFTDGLKRVLQTKKDATIHVSPMGGTQDVMTVSGRVIFDALGRTEKQYYPVTEAKGSNSALNPTFGDGIAPTRTFYDVLDRTVRTELPDGTRTNMAYGFGSDRNGLNQFMTTVWDANDHRKESFRDVNELITTVREYNGGQTIQTSYVYDPLKQITKVIDDRGNETSVRYDNLGRRTIIDNADTGRTETVYDTAGNVIRKITANLKGQGKSVSYDYDHNRLTAISYPTFPANNVSYTYGASGDAYNRAGRIRTVANAAGVEARYYGKLGETVKENFCRRSSHCSKPGDADQPNAQPSNSAITDALHAGTEDLHDIEHDNEHAPLYVTQYVYDTFGRLQRLTYPDGEVLTYGYDSGGLVNKATGVKGKFSYPYLKRLDYDKFDQRVYLQLGNGVTTSYAYRLDNRRLDALQAQLPNVTHYQFQNLGYRYDNVGNILGIANNSLYPKGQQGIGEEVGGPVTQSYIYDDLYRLKEASGEYRHEADELRRYRMGMDYDSIHNIVAKEQLDEEVEKENGKTETEVEHETSYTYGYHYAAPQTGSNTGSIHPHAPSEIGHYSFQYDSNGNQLERRYRDDEDTRQIVWDEDNRMGCVHEFEHEHPSQVIAQVPVNCSSTAEKLNHDGRNILNGSHTPEVRFVYNDKGERVFKESDDNVSFYLNPHYTEKSDDAYKHILIGTTRLVTQEVERETHEAEDDLYYYHPDHLGSSSFVTDRNGKLEEHLEYFPFGETWIEEESSLPIAFRFTAKELDSETGLYYFGARYYDPRTSVWQSADPILGKYLPSGNKEQDAQLPSGGIFNSLNINLYHYAGLNPVKFVDADGNNFYAKYDPHGGGGFGHSGVGVDNGRGGIKTADFGMHGFVGQIWVAFKSLFGSHDAYVNVNNNRKKSTLPTDTITFQTSKKMDEYLRSRIGATHSDTKFPGEGKQAKHGYNAIMYNCGDYTADMLKEATGGKFTEHALTPGGTQQMIREHKDEIQKMISDFEKTKPWLKKPSKSND